ncbi:MAG: hypothetical protein ACU837_02020 [Gammaproteobacteria bacterium]
MRQAKGYVIDRPDNTVAAVVTGIDRDVERGEDILMLGFCLVGMSSFFAPIAPPNVLLPIVALTFALSASFARINYWNMARKLMDAMEQLNGPEKALLHPIAAVFAERPMEPLTASFNPLKNLRRTGKSALGGLLINPLWMPIFYVMGIQIFEEKQLGVLSRAVCGVMHKISPPPPRDQ